ncbi:hypothetical protein [Galbibacter pacificus]|uniref:Uncharacterized protein n=1 Tax=Galbibacter pacificus TaxID=2996052 RepID=A0ABT6FRD9_9FLAO|nr:hypothetical protein [Galbibacter pacificus]MDG3581860.1 hypothetical protein [Galbibacter pacificus]MDG3585666.1 hypothetical protein [Galbibacter pacificus]
MEIIGASINDNEILTELVIKSKLHWGYSKKEMDSCENELTITAEYLKRNNAYKLIDNRKLIVFFAYIIRNNKKVELDFFFIFPRIYW